MAAKSILFFSVEICKDCRKNSIEIHDAKRIHLSLGKQIQWYIKM
jgi:hypothetical protein